MRVLVHLDQQSQGLFPLGVSSVEAGSYKAVSKYVVEVKLPSANPLLPIVLSHHERIDGKGYPQSIPGVDIPLNARIAAIADTFDALTSNRPYRDGMPLEKAIAILESVKGTQLDAELVEVFIEKVRERGIIPVRDAQDLTRVTIA